MDLLLNNYDKLMDNFAKEPNQALFHHLALKGMNEEIIPSYIRSMRICLANNPTINLLQLDTELQYLGWNNFRLDFPTLQLAKSCFKAETIGFQI